MSLKKLALIALIVVVMVSSIVFFGCKPKEVVEEAIDTTTVEVEEVDDSVQAVVEETAEQVK